ncbi:MAG: divalent metal cation transporter [Rhodospirillales bacterium]
MSIKRFLAVLGPGILFAAAAVGVSHLVQATRAGADYGFALVGFVLLALVAKYPFFEFGPRYTAATGESLLDGYKRCAPWALVLFLVLTFVTMFATLAAVTLVTASLAANLFPLDLPIAGWSGLILGLILLLLILGRYPLLDRITKVLMILLTLATLAAAVLAAGDPAPRVAEVVAPEIWTVGGIAFVVALFGWMPAPIEVSVWYSLWAVERRKQVGENPGLRGALLDFNVGYGLTSVLALLFLALGAWVMYGSGESFPAGAVAFTGSLISLYTQVLGDWTWPLVAVAALSTMFSTTLAVTDAYPRIWRRALELYWPGAQRLHESLYWLALLLVSAGAFVIIVRFAEDLRGLVDLATTVAFLSAPLYAYINYRTVTHPSVPSAQQPPTWLRLYAWVALACLTAFSLFFVVWRFG